MMEVTGSKEIVEHYHAEKNNLMAKLFGGGNRSCSFQLRAGKAGRARASWRIHAWRHEPRGGKRRDARFESGFECAFRYVARGSDEFAGEHGSHENAAAAGSDLGSAVRRLASCVSSQARRFERQHCFGNSAAPHRILEREPRRFSLPQ